MKRIGMFLLGAWVLNLIPVVWAQGSAFTYQGKLNDGATAASGRYDFRFKLYRDALGTVQAGSSSLADGVGVSNGLFSTTVDFGAEWFAGSNYWLEVAVKTNGGPTYTALAPLQALTPTPYAIYANTASNVLGPVRAFQLSGTVPSANVSGSYANPLTFNNTLNQFAGNGAGLTALNASALTSGTVADARISATLARDSEILPTVLANDGPGSGLEADQLDGLHASSFASATHTHSGLQYFTVGSEAFVPGENVDYRNTYGNGGAYITAGSGAMVAPVHLPQGAVVTEFRLYYYDASPNDLVVYLQRQGFSGGYSTLARYTTTGTPGYGSGIDTTISDATIDNTTGSYSVYAWSSAWNYNLMIKAAVVVYTVNSVP